MIWVPPHGRKRKDSDIQHDEHHGPVIGEVATRGETNHAAVIDQVGRPVADGEFPTTPAGYRALLACLRAQGQLDERVGVEGTGAYGAALSRYLRGQGVVIVEVDRPDRKTRRQGQERPDRRLRSRPRCAVRASQWHPEDPRRQGRSDPGVTAGAIQRRQGRHPGDQPVQEPARHRTRRPA
ncbi:MAG TPA: transposase [Pseudonocardiaceae bacterium]|nr:transposase [Pseudonocardiaceae bacterium]